MTTQYIDYLKEDEPITGQSWVCISFLSPEGIKNCSIRGLKIRGVYGTKKEADDKASELHKKDSDFHVFVGEIGKWLPWDPDPNDVKDQVYLEKELNDLMKVYLENQEKAKKMENDRKHDLISKAAKEEQLKLNKTRDKLRKTHEQRKKNKEIDSIILTEKEKEVEEMEKSIKEEEDLSKKERLRLNETQKQINEKSQALESMDIKL
jgi:hypothetical protein